MKLYTRIISAALLGSTLIGSATAQERATQKPEPTKNAQNAPGNSAPPYQSPDIAIRKLPKNIFEDQKRIWTGPVHLRAQDLRWAVPLVFGGALAFGVDHSVQRHMASNPSRAKNGTSLSNYGAAAFAGVVAAQYLWGIHTQDSQLKETGYLAGEAAVDSLLVTTIAKGVARRERPRDGTGQGRFFESSSFSSSFPSQHAAAAWSIATVIAKEYPGPLTKIFAYGGASAISIARVVGNNHFASDALVGSALGYYIGRQVYAAHSSEATLDRYYGTFEKTAEKNPRDPSLMGSPYVPLDSWVYPAFDRLEALGYFRAANTLALPWTRKYCAELLDSVEIEDETDPQIREILTELQEEFKVESGLLQGDRNVWFRLREVYARVQPIAGTPLTDEMHFAQTVYNDYGRPFGKGVSAITGISGDAAVGPLAFSVRGDYWHAPSIDPLSLSARTAIAAQDKLPLQPGVGVDTQNKFRLLDAYVALNVSDWQLSFGKQSLWWEPTRGESLMYSNNSEPLTMLRLTRVAPMRLPWLSVLFGNIGSTTFLAQTQGYHFLKLGSNFQLTGSWTSHVDPQPYIFGQHFSVKPTQNLEIGISLTTVLGGQGLPMTLNTFRHSFSTSGNLQSVEPGDRRTGFGFKYKLPGLRNLVTLYSGSLAEDEINPLGYPRRSAINPGVYITHLPKLARLDLRVEGGYTDLPNLTNTGFFYTNTHYSGGYTNEGKIIGSWIGPEARAVQAQSNYWFAAQRKLTFSFRSETVNPAYISGGDLKDFGVGYNFRTASNVSIALGMQYENWRFPILSNQRESNVLFSARFGWSPSSSKKN